MSWVRLDDHFPDNPKIVSAGPLAAWLYVTGLCYCNRLLTDGFVPISQVDRLSPHRDDQDLRDSPLHLAQRLCGLGLWMEGEQKGVPGFVIHDYRKYQPSRKEILRQRRQNAGRQTRFRKASTNGLRGERNGHRNGVTNGVSNDVCSTVSNDGPVPVPVPVLREISLSLVETPTKPATSLAPDDIAARAGHLIRHYADLYAKHRHGAKLRLIGNSLEFQDACSLVALWDDDRLDKLAVIVLESDDEFIAKTDRSFKIFSLKATWADDRLRAWEREHGFADEA